GDGIRFGEDGDAARHGQKAADVEVFAGLGLDALVSGDDKHDHVNAANSSEHVANETFVSGDVDESETQKLAVRSGQFEMREADVNGDAAAFFLFEAVGIDTGQRFDQRGLAVIDVAGGANDYGLHANNSISGPICVLRTSF